MKEKILKLLRESGTYVSGQKLCNELNVSRTAVWKRIKQLQEEGYNIAAITNKGYLLIDEPDIITKEAVMSRLHTKTFGQTMEYFDCIDSTNNYCKREAENGAEHGFLAVADRQDAGRGRRGRSWSTPSGTSIAMSFLLRPELSPDRASMLTIVAAMAVAKSIQEVTGLSSAIKWPNDIIIGKKKVCGILTELSVELTAINYVVVGIGINVNNASFPDEIKETATSLLLEKGEPVSRSSIIAGVADAFETYYDQFIREKSLAAIKADYDSFMINKDKPVRIIQGDGQVCDEGIALGIDDFGRLRIKTEQGEKTVFAGEVSVRGLNGYV